MQGRAHQACTRQNDAADVLTICLDGINRNRRACANHHEVITVIQCACAEQLCVAVAAHLGFIVISVVAIGVWRVVSCARCGQFPKVVAPSQSIARTKLLRHMADANLIGRGQGAPLCG